MLPKKLLTATSFLLPGRKFIARESAFSFLMVNGYRHHSVKACIVGSGPAGFYTAQKLLKSRDDISVDVIERLPVPFGLVRYGVAPDHPEVKNVINGFTQSMEKYSGRCVFLGNVNVGQNISVAELRSFYDIVVLSYGAEDDKRLDIPGEDITGVYSAKEFVGWYNGVPENRELVPCLDTETAVIMGQGNVALDITRMLLLPIDVLAKTDISEHALELLSKSRVRNVHIVGRRGPSQVAFTIKEFRELTKITNVQPCVAPADVQHIDDVSALPRPRRRLTDLMIQIAKRPVVQAVKRWKLDFLLTPKEIQGDERVAAMSFYQNILTDDQKAQATELTTSIPCGLVIRSIGYKSQLIDNALPFDTRQNTLIHDRGRIEPGLYCSGWVKRGPVGVIADTMTDAVDTATTILDDIKHERMTPRVTDQSLSQYLMEREGLKLVDFDGWVRIDKEELRLGALKGQSRHKITNINKMIDIAYSH